MRYHREKVLHRVKYTAHLYNIDKIFSLVKTKTRISPEMEEKEYSFLIIYFFNILGVKNTPLIHP